MAEEEEVAEPAPAPEPQQRALVDEAEDLRRQQQGMDKEKTKRAEEEARMLREAARVGTNALKVRARDCGRHSVWSIITDGLAAPRQTAGRRTSCGAAEEVVHLV